jgi:P4 family phage/plasmid primase-like protien
VVPLIVSQAHPECPPAQREASGGDCPLWRKFLHEITGGNSELQSFLQHIAGYVLTGSIREHALFFFYGTGGNGKGVFLNTITAILADHAAVAPMETFIITQGERHPTDLAGLRGARLVTAQETKRGRRWAESKIKPSQRFEQQRVVFDSPWSLGQYGRRSARVG